MREKIREYYLKLMILKELNGKYAGDKKQYVRMFHAGYSQAMDEAIETLKSMFGLGEYEE